MRNQNINFRNTLLSRGLFGSGVLIILGILFFFLWAEHKAHLLGALPYLLLLLCPVMHFFMHKGHNHSHGQHGDADKNEAVHGKGDPS